MTKIATTKPQEIRRPVRITSTRYELWYAKPLLLGEINKKGDYWYTTDEELRFHASRDALSYMIRVQDLQTRLGKDLTEEQKKKIYQKIVDPRTSRVRVPQQRAGAVTEESDTSVDYNQNHPLFQEFLEFMEFRNKRRLVTPA